MKKLVIGAALLATGILFAHTEAKAQGTYLKLGAAYNIGIGAEMHYNSTSTSNFSGNNGSYSQTAEIVKVNYGKGLVPNGTIGYLFNEHLGAELGIGYLLGGESETTIKSTSATGNNINYSDYSGKAHSRMFLLQPAFVISAGMDGFNPYARFGMVAAKGSVIISESRKNTNFTEEMETKVSGGWAIGMQGGLGVDINLNDKISFFTELTMNNLNYSPEKAVITKATANGADVLKDATTRQKEMLFVDKITESSNDTPSDSEPDKSLKMNLPFGSVGFGAGLKFKI